MKEICLSIYNSEVMDPFINIISMYEDYVTEYLSILYILGKQYKCHKGFLLFPQGGQTQLIQKIS